MKGIKAQLIVALLIVALLLGNGKLLTAIAKNIDEVTTISENEKYNCAEGEGNEIANISEVDLSDRDIVYNAKWGERFGTVEFDVMSPVEVNLYVWLKRGNEFVANLGQNGIFDGHFEMDFDSYFDTTGSYTFEIWELTSEEEWIPHFTSSSLINYTESNRSLSRITKVNYDVNRKLSWGDVDNALCYDVDIYRKNGNEYEYMHSYKGDATNTQAYRYLYELSFGELYVKIKAIPKNRNEYRCSESDYIKLIPTDKKWTVITDASWSDTVPGSIECTINSDSLLAVQIYMIDADTSRLVDNEFIYIQGRGKKLINVQELFAKSGNYKFCFAGSASSALNVSYSYISNDIFRYTKPQRDLATVESVSWKSDNTVRWNHIDKACGYMVDIYEKNSDGELVWCNGWRDVKNNYVDISKLKLNKNNTYYVQIRAYSENMLLHNSIETGYLMLRFENELPSTEVPKTEVPKTEVPKTEVPKTEVPKTEVPKTEVPKTEVPKTEVPKTEVPKTEVPKTEVPKTEAPKTEVPKTEVPTKEPVRQESIVLTNIEFGDEVDLSGYNYSSIKKIIVSLSGTANNYSGSIVLGGWAEQMLFGNDTCKDYTVTFEVTNPQGTLTVYKWWSDSDLKIKKIELIY